MTRWPGATDMLRSCGVQTDMCRLSLCWAIRSCRGRATLRLALASFAHGVHVDADEVSAAIAPKDCRRITSLGLTCCFATLAGGQPPKTTCRAQVVHPSPANVRAPSKCAIGYEPAAGIWRRGREDMPRKMHRQRAANERPAPICRDVPRLA